MDAAVAVTFSGEGDPVVTGPARALRLQADRMIAEPSGALFARYEDHHWVVNGRSFVRWAIEGTAAVLCEDHTGKSVYLGTFAELRGIDGALWAASHLIASRVSDAPDWTVYPLNARWSVLRLVAAKT
jgi:hypothetical protein